MPSLKEKMQELINTESRENDSDTPDFILAEYLERNGQAGLCSECKIVLKPGVCFRCGRVLKPPATR